MAAILAAILVPATARASDRWEQGGSGAVALLPEPQKAKGVLGASLYCAEQRWSFLLRLEPGAAPAGWKSPATLTVGESSFDSEAVESVGSLAVAVPAEILPPLRAGSRLTFTAGTLEAAFSLKGSAAAIDAIAPLCSEVDMSAYAEIVLSDDSPDLPTARALLADEAALFRTETNREPSYAAAAVELQGGNRLLFARLCGPTSYYGKSGCTLQGHALFGGAGEWRQVYHTEGLRLFVDPKQSTYGWPNLVTLRAGAVETEHWNWNGGDYVNADRQVAGDVDSDEPEQGDGG